MAEQRIPHQHRRLDNRPSHGLARRIVGLFGPYKLPVAAVGLLIVLSAGLGVVNPVLVKEVFDSALFPASGSPDLMLLWILAGVIAAIAVVGGLVSVVQSYLTGKVGQGVTGDLQEAVYGHLLGMSVNFLARTRTGEMQSRVSHDINGIEPVVASAFADSISSAAALIAVLVAMLFLSWEFTVVAMAMLPVFLLLSRWVGRRRREVMGQAQNSMAQVTAITEETLSMSGILLAKLFGRQHDELHHFRRHNEELSRFAIRQRMIAQSFYATVTAFLALSPALVYLAAGYLIFAGDASVASAGTIIAFTALQSRLYQPMERLLQVSVELQTSLALFDRIFGYLDLEQDITDAPDAISLQRGQVRGEVVFDSVRVESSRFSGRDSSASGGRPHPNPPPQGEGSGSSPSPQGEGSGGIPSLQGEGSGGSPSLQGEGTEGSPSPKGEGMVERQWALDGVTFRIRPGQLAAFVGPSGAGKTTIAALVPRLRDATDGSVSIDGIDVRRIRLADLSAAVGFVTQESFLLQATIEENLRYAKPDASDEDILAATKAASIHDRIMELPAGYATLVGERGFGLSIGERQRLSIARALLHEPRILILDEATSALDTASERLLQSALAPMVQGRTTLVIAHRLSTILAADVIFTVVGGRINDFGTHAELLER